MLVIPGEDSLILYKVTISYEYYLVTGGATRTGLSSGALGGIVAGVFIALVIILCIVLFGFCCWNNYQDSLTYSYNPPRTSDDVTAQSHNPASDNNNSSSTESSRSTFPHSSLSCGCANSLLGCHCLRLNLKDCLFCQNRDTHTNVCHNCNAEPDDQEANVTPHNRDAVKS